MGIKVIEAGGSTFKPGTTVGANEVAAALVDGRTSISLLGRRFGEGGRYSTQMLGPSSPKLDQDGTGIKESSGLKDLAPGQEVEIGSLRIKGF